MPGSGETRAGTEAGEKSRAKLIDGKTSRITEKKMIQARLPFKRLNPVPREKEALSQGKKQKTAQKVSPLNTVSPIDLFAEDVENGCKMETEEMQPLPKATNGPLDIFVRKLSKACRVTPSITIDLTEDSNSGPVDHLPSDGKTQPSLANGPILKNCELVRSQTVSQIVTDADVLKTSDRDANRQSVPVEETAEITVNLPHSTELPLISPTNTVELLITPVKASIDLVLAEDNAPTSSRTSPTSSPEASTSISLKNALNYEPSADINKVTVCSKHSETKKPKEREQEEKKRKLQTEKGERDRIREESKLAKERAKEEAKRKKDEEKEQKAKEKKEKKEKEDREKAEKLRLKEERKKGKLEALEAKQEEKRKKEEEKRVKEEEKRMKAEKAEITRFLQKSKSSHTPKTFAQSCGKFAPFEIKKNMVVAPLCRVEFEQENSEQLDQFLKEQSPEVNYLSEIKTRKPRVMGRTETPEVPLFTSDTDDVQAIVETDLNLQHTVPAHIRTKKMKLLQFCENHRPAYWGTWNKLSRVICPRKPWAQDTIVLDYEVDSDEEWEEEEPGESLSHSEGDEDDDDAKEDDDDDDDGFFVPHGYLSEDEGGISDEESKNPENQKVRQKLKAKEWDELQAKGKKINVLKPVLIGCVWLGTSTAEIPFLQKFAACVLDSVLPIDEDVAQESNSNRTLKDQEILVHLLPLLHGNVNGSKGIIQEFQECCRRGLISPRDNGSNAVSQSVSPNSQQQTPSSINVPSKARLKRIISENSVYEKRPDHRMCWYVHADILKSFQQEGLPVPCQWTYVTQMNPASRDETGHAGGQLQATPTSGKRKSAGSMPITMFMKKAADVGSMTDVGADIDDFQADTEEDYEDDDDDDDCMIVEDQSKKDQAVPSKSSDMEVTMSEDPATVSLKA